MKELIKNPIQICIAIACLAIAVYFVVLTYKQLKPQTYEEQKMHCLGLGSDARAIACVKLINNHK